MITLYTTHCPKCMVLEKKLKIKNIEFETVTDEAIMREKGYMSVPVLEVDGQVLEFAAANAWLNTQN